MTSADRVKEIREILGLTQAGFGDSLGFKWYKIKDIEAGKIKVSPDIALKISNLHGYRFEWILTGEGPMKKEDQASSKETVLTSYPPVANGFAEFSIADDLIIAAKVLESKTHYANSLHLNIQSFAEAVAAEKERQQCKEDIRKQGEQLQTLQSRLDVLERQEKTLQKEIIDLKGSDGGCPPIDLGMDHAARTGTDDPKT